MTALPENKKAGVAKRLIACAARHRTFTALAITSALAAAVEKGGLPGICTRMFAAGCEGR